jgi:endonuclease YncB( thermonuclease family)
MTDEWDAFPDGPDDSDPWAAFPDAPAKGKRGQKRRKRGRGTLPAETVLADPVATDGDTVRADQGMVRLAGVDAPELRQQGWDRKGRPVPIGRNALAELRNLIDLGPSTTGNAVGLSYDRTVAPLTVEGADAGRHMLRTGNALAETQFLASDPTRARQYQQDERLARVNGLGLHDTLTPSPAEFRADPNYVPNRQTVARFFDTPTPLEGFRPEVEQQYLHTLANGSADQILAFVRAQGTDMREKELRQWVKWRDDERKAGRNPGVEAIYERGPEALIDSGDGVAGAIIRKGASGVLAGGLDEIGAVVDTLGGTPGRESLWNSDRRAADIWANNQRQNSAILSYDQEAHPIASTAAEIGGSILGGFVIPYGQGARTMPQLAKVGGVFGGATGFLGTDGSVADRALGGVKGMLAGAVATPVLGKTIEAVAPVVAAGSRKLLGRDAQHAAGQASGGIGARSAPDVAPEAPAGNFGDDWSAFPDATDPADAEVDALLRSGAGVATVNSVLKQQGREPIPLAEFKTRKAKAMEAARGESVSMTAPRQRDYLDMGPERPRPLLDDYNSSERAGAAARVQPRDVLPVPGNTVVDAEEAAAIEAGRYAPAKPVNEREYLDRGTVRGINGPVPKVGPVDMVGWLRLKGGLKPDEGGELAHMGITNAPRRGLDHVGQEHRFGPLVNDHGMNLDDAALRAWEEGYFPELNERPTINQFLEALRDTYEGNYARRFRTEDQPQIEAFEAARQERYALEQQLYDGPVSVDRSAPAYGERPFTPPEAYDDASREAIRRVGNLDVSRLNSPQDIARALKTSHGAMGGFDAATRGRIAHVETERLAADLGMTAGKLLSRRKGQAFNAEEALAARQILAKSGNELVNAARAISKREDPGEELLAEFRRKWMRHVAIQEQVSGMTAEAGRALQQFRMAASSRAVRTDVLNAMVRGGGGKGNLRDAADALLNAVEMGPGKFNVLAQKAAKPKWHRKVGELYINMLLSNPPTHLVNMVSNTLTSLAQIPEYATASILGAGRRAIVGEKARERIMASEVGARTFGLVQGAKEGLELFANALKTGEADDLVSKVEGDEFKAISGLKGEVIRIPTRLLTAEDQFFKGIARRMAVNGLSMRKAQREGLKGEALAKRVAELTADPSDDILHAAMDEGLYLTFQRRLGPFGQAMSNLAGSNLLAKIVVPFVRTPINLMKFAAERSPAAPLLKEWRDDFRAGGERRDLAVAKVLLGSGLATMIYQAAQEGRITGGVPPDPKKARLLYADGWQPYSIKVGDRYVSYSRVDPFATTIGVAADMATLPGGLSDRQADEKATLLIASLVGNMASKTWMSGVAAFSEALADPGRYADAWVQRTAGAFTVPAGVAGLARAIDPVMRKRESVPEAIQARVPGMTDELLPRRDIFGEPIPIDSLGPDFLSPFSQSRAKNDPVVAEMLRIDKGVSAPGKQYTEDGEKLDYSPERYDRYHEIAGRFTYNELLGLIGSDVYRAMSDNARRKAAAKAIMKARQDARAVLDDPDYPLPAKGAAVAADPWGAFPAAPGGKAEPVDDPWSGFPDASERDVRADLERAIPGIRFTSGYRDPAYNASLRARGYNPADNSEHMDGAALDMLPPPGKSLGWLRAQVKRYDPKARLLVHDGHLHGGFVGYYAAPKLGGMAGR